MDGDAIGLTTFAGIVFGAITAFVLWARARGLKRKHALETRMQAIGFQPIAAPPPDFPLQRFPIVRWGEKGGRRGR